MAGRWRARAVACAVLLALAASTVAVSASGTPHSSGKLGLRRARRLVTRSSSISAAALSTHDVVAASYAGDASMVVAQVVGRQPCQTQLVPWDTSQAKETGQIVTLPDGFCVGAMAWSPSLQKVVITEAHTGETGTLDPATWTLAGVGPEQADLGLCSLDKGMKRIPSCATATADVFVAWGSECVGKAAAGNETKLAPDALPTIGSAIHDLAVGQPEATCAAQRLYVAASVQCFGTGCNGTKNHDALLTLDASTLSLTSQVPVVGIGDVTAVHTAMLGEVVVHSFSVWPRTALQFRRASDLTVVAANLTVADLNLTLSATDETPTALRVVPFASNGTFVWMFATRDTDVSQSYDTLVLAVVRIDDDGGIVTPVVDDVRTIDMTRVAHEFGPAIAQQLLASPLDGPVVHTCFDGDNSQAILAISFGSDDAGIKVTAGLAVQFEANGTIVEEQTPTTGKRKSRFYYKRKWPLGATLAIIAALVIVAMALVIVVARRRARFTQGRQQYAELDEPGMLPRPDGAMGGLALRPLSAAAAVPVAAPGQSRAAQAAPSTATGATAGLLANPSSDSPGGSLLAQAGGAPLAAIDSSNPMDRAPSASPPPGAEDRYSFVEL